MLLAATPHAAPATAPRQGRDLDLGHIFRTYGPAYLEQFGKHLPKQHWKAIFAIPGELRPLALRNLAVVYDILFRAANGVKGGKAARTSHDQRRLDVERHGRKETMEEANGAAATTTVD